MTVPAVDPAVLAAPAVEPASAQAAAEPDTADTATEPATDLSGLPESAQIKALRAEAAKYRVRAKELEDAQKSELQKALDALEESKAALNATRTELARNRVMAEHGLAPDFAEFLSGDEAQMKAAAQKLAALAAADKTASLTQSPAAALQSGASAPAAEDDDWDPAEIARQVRESSSIF